MMEEEKVKLSVIVPCYNVEAYLEGLFACLDKQWGERTDHEVVFVNDGSTDRTQALLEQYVAADSRHRVLMSQDNQGVSAARNAGMEVARGEWITFVDPDDLLVDGGYNFLLKRFIDDSCDVLSFERLKVDLPLTLDLALPISDNVLWEGNTLHKQELLLPSVCSCMYRLRTLRKYGLNFSVKATFAEDALLNASLFSKGVKIRMVDSMIYYYVQHAQSICHTSDIAKLRKSIEGLIYCADKVRTFSNPNYTTDHWVKFFVLFIASHLMRGDFSVREVRQIRDRLIGMKVFPLTSPWRTERLYFAALAHPRLLPLVRTAVKLKKKLKAIRN